MNRVVPGWCAGRPVTGSGGGGCARLRSPLAPTLALLIVHLTTLGGCQSLAPSRIDPDRHVLAVFANDLDTVPVTAASTRGYRDGSGWPVSLHTLARARRVVRDHGLHQVYAWPVRALDIYCVVLETPPGTSREALLARLQADPRVVRAQPVHSYRGMFRRMYDDPLFDVQFGEHRQTLESLHAVTRGAGVRVGIIDGQVDLSHPDLRGQLRARYGPTGANHHAMLRHGTAVAGVIAAAAGNNEGLVGLAPDARVSVYAACDTLAGAETRCTSVSLAEALEHAIADGSDVINMSLAGPRDWLLEQLLRTAHERDVVLIAAANPTAGPVPGAQSFPGSLPFVHAVGDRAGPWFTHPEQFSTLAGGGYQLFVGASMSAAGATGIATLLRSRRSAGETRAQLRHVLDADCDLIALLDRAAPVSPAPASAPDADPPLLAVSDDAHCRR